MSRLRTEPTTTIFARVPVAIAEAVDRCVEREQQRVGMAIGLGRSIIIRRALQEYLQKEEVADDE